MAEAGIGVDIVEISRMKSILENRPELAYEVNQAAEVAGYLWQKGWAERNGGNITLNITEYVDDEIRALPAISEVKQIGKVLPYLKGCYFYCKGTQMRMRDLARWPMGQRGELSWVHFASSSCSPF